MAYFVQCIHDPRRRAAQCEICSRAGELVAIGSWIDSPVVAQQNPQRIPPAQGSDLGQQRPTTMAHPSRHSGHHASLPVEREDVSYQETYNAPWSPCQPHVPSAAERVFETHRHNLPSSGQPPRSPNTAQRESDRAAPVPCQTPLTEGYLRQFNQQQATQGQQHYTRARGDSSTTARVESASIPPAARPVRPIGNTSDSQLRGSRPVP